MDVRARVCRGARAAVDSPQRRLCNSPYTPAGHAGSRCLPVRESSSRSSDHDDHRHRSRLDAPRQPPGRNPAHRQMLERRGNCARKSARPCSGATRNTTCRSPTTVRDLEDESFADLIVDLSLAEIDRDLEELRAIDVALLRIAGRHLRDWCEVCERAIESRDSRRHRRPGVASIARRSTSARISGSREDAVGSD